LDKGQLLRTLGQSLEAKVAFSHLDDCQLDAPEQQALNNWLYEVDEEISLANQYLEEGLSPLEITLNIDTTSYETPTEYASSNFYFGMWILGPGQYSFMHCGSDLQFRTLEQEGQKSTIRIYPNPTESGIKMDVSEAGYYDVSIYNSVGQAVMRFENVSIRSTHEFPETWMLPAGVYQLTAVSQSGTETHRFVKQ
jgi:Secretion system C-terminal sorting domain